MAPENDNGDTQDQPQDNARQVTPEDLDNLRSTKDREISELRKELEELKNQPSKQSRPANTEYGRAQRASEEQQTVAELQEQLAQKPKEAAESRDTYWQKYIEYRDAGIPDNVLKVAGNTAEDLEKTAEIFKTLKGGETPGDNSQGNGRVGSSPNSTQSNSWSEMSSPERVEDWMSKHLPPISQSR